MIKSIFIVENGAGGNGIEPRAGDRRMVVRLQVAEVNQRLRAVKLMAAEVLELR